MTAPLHRDGVAELGRTEVLYVASALDVIHPGATLQELTDELEVHYYVVSKIRLRPGSLQLQEAALDKIAKKLARNGVVGVVTRADMLAGRFDGASKEPPKAPLRGANLASRSERTR